MDKISVIVPVYKVEKYLKKCIESIISQSYKNLEIILVDDGSPDNCGKICDEYIQKDKRIKVIHKKNGGLSSARNAGLNIATGDYIGFVDSDDWIEFDMYKKMIECILKQNVDVVQCGMILNYENSEKKDFILNNIKNCHSPIESYLSDNIRPEVCNKLYKRSIIGTTRFNEDTKFGEDVEFNYFIFKKVKRFIEINFYGYNYLKRNNSIMCSFINKESIHTIINTFEKIISLEFGSKYHYICIDRYLKTCFAILNQLFINNSYSEFLYIKNKIFIYYKYIIKKSNFKYKIGFLMLLLGKNFYKIMISIHLITRKFIERSVFIGRK